MFQSFCLSKRARNDDEGLDLDSIILKKTICLTKSVGARAAPF